MDALHNSRWHKVQMKASLCPQSQGQSSEHQSQRIHPIAAGPFDQSHGITPSCPCPSIHWALGVRQWINRQYVCFPSGSCAS